MIKDFKKVLSVNRGTVITMLVCLGLMLLGFLAILITGLILPDKQEAATAFIIVPLGGMILNIWVVLFCCLMMYTVGYTGAVGLGMTRKAYLRSSFVLTLAYTVASALISLLSAGVVLLFSFSQTGVITEKMQQKALMIAGLALVLTASFLLFAALGRIFAYVLLRYGAKMMAAPILAVSALFMLLPKGIDLYETIPQSTRLTANLALGAAAVLLIAALTVVGRRLIYRYSI
ncbi:hypothetical protein [Acetanaerobacterium elongatum]|uniref:Uncharacterized protein n=1 Tax=Acetanaerobacterium elongatum TaxID=258515 RepID=A0A1G9VAA7_9FIRM|nr:hypothetical protein [Acetanaerobacterium elongatum]SDM69124.1 hypothetical protein SAMN05192585_103108 [Acetanaerobacterium elongatum]